MQVMIVEDNPVFLRSLSTMLQQHFPAMNILGVESVEEAETQLAATVPALICLDVRLGNRSGLDLIGKIKALNAATAVMVLTSFHLPEYRTKALENGADYFFTKDVDAHEIVDCISRDFFCQSTVRRAPLAPELTASTGVQSLRRRSSH